jgi:hypothetical protein
LLKDTPDLNAELGRVAEQWSAETLRQADAREEFSARYGARVATVPLQAHPPNDLAGLADMLEHSEGVPWDQLLP